MQPRGPCNAVEIPYQHIQYFTYISRGCSYNQLGSSTRNLLVAGQGLIICKNDAMGPKVAGHEQYSVKSWTEPNDEPAREVIGIGEKPVPPDTIPRRDC